MKRFYKEADVAEDSGRYAVRLDGRAIKTPDRSDLSSDNETLARLSAEEWNAQVEKIVPDSMPLTQLLNTRIDRITAQRKTLEREVLKYINTDLLCYRADNPEELVSRQNKHWQKHLDWFERESGLSYIVTTGLAALKQDDRIHAHIAADVAALDDDRFTILQMVTPACGSPVLALAFIKGAACVDELMACAFLEEDYKFDFFNEALHGGDPLTEKKRIALRRDLEAGEKYLKALS